jgi:hypothetical protein
MKPIRTIRRLAGILAGLATAALAFAAAAAPAALATLPPPEPAAPPGVTPPVVIHTGGMAGWQITLIAAGAALLTAVLAILLDRARTARRHMTAPGI